jgi:hypothetical protein
MNLKELTAEQVDSLDSKAVLRELIDEAAPQYENRKRLNQALGISIGLLGISLSLGATISGIWSKDPRIAAAFSACAATTQAILFAYPVEKRAAAYRVIAAKNKNLAVDLELKQLDAEQFDSLVERFKEIRLEAALEEAKSGRLERTASDQDHSRQSDQPQLPVKSRNSIQESSVEPR